MPKIILSTLNAKYIHASFGLRYLLANLPDDLRALSDIVEFTINQRPIDIVAHLLSLNPSIIGFGVYIWNTTLTFEVISLLKAINPDITLILGGPEVSYETHLQPITALAHFVITHEAEVALPTLLRQLLAAPGTAAANTLAASNPAADTTASTQPTIIHGGSPPIDSLCMPYDLYTDADIAQRVIYVEASRGCPFKCEFCLSSLDKGVRKFPLAPFLAQMQRLLDRGLNQFKFVDRTFNLSIETSQAILEFFLARDRPGLFIHFEMVPDRLPEALRDLIARFRPGSLQFEVGIQTWNPAVAARISRRQDYDKIQDNLTFLHTHTGVHVHADLIIGLPGETWDSIGRGFDALIALRVSEIQVGLLKRLRGTPIIRHDLAWDMRYSPLPPYELLQSKTLSFDEVQSLVFFAKCWDQLANSGRFPDVVKALNAHRESAFTTWTHLSAWLKPRVPEGGAGVRLDRWVELLFQYLIEALAFDEVAAAQLVLADYWRGGRRDDVPPALRAVVEAGGVVRAWREERRRKHVESGKTQRLPKRQARHLVEESAHDDTTPL
jgi:radical SAM superfamily enzyme YgiQ (UPF0313 family)